MSPEPPSQRRDRRAPVTLVVQYRTAGSFLVSYSVNLSRGGLFLETPRPLPEGTTLTVRFDIPGTWQAIETEARVIWSRQQADAAGPPGVGLAFDNIDQQIGEQIDELVRNFTGVRVLAVAGDAASQQKLARYLAASLNCTVVRAASADDATARIGPSLDLVLIDIDSLGAAAAHVISVASAQRPAVPVIGLARASDARQLIARHGATALDNPPPFEELRSTLLDLLGRPLPGS